MVDTIFSTMLVLCQHKPPFLGTPHLIPIECMMMLKRCFFCSSREDGKWDGREVFYQMLRPEFVRSYKTPLSSDVFTGWSIVRST